MPKVLQAPFPWFGGKSRVADVVWSRFGDVPNYVEPFAGSLAVLLGRPHAPRIETINDLDGFVVNFWRAVQADPEAVARWADNPVFECDLHARHTWLVARKDALGPQLEADPDYFDAKIAGWWCWGLCCWIGSGWCSGNGPWHTTDMEDGTRRLVKRGDGEGVNRKLPHLGNAGRGVNRKLPHLGSAGRGVNRKLPHLGSAGRGVALAAYLATLAARLERVRLCCGDWSRVLGPSVTFKHGITAILLDPPYADTANRAPNLYREESDTVAHAVREWAIAAGDNPKLRIALCGYEGEHAMPPEWGCVPWKTQGGMSNQNREGNPNRHRERIWFSPACLKPGNAELEDAPFSLSAS